MVSPEMMNNDLASRLASISLKSMAQNLDGFIARASKNQWQPRTMLEELCKIEIEERSRHSLERRLKCSGIGRFKPVADFDWNWPRKIDRDIIAEPLSIHRSLLFDTVHSHRKSNSNPGTLFELNAIDSRYMVACKPSNT